jgi:uncharacterized membrane protein
MHTPPPSQLTWSLWMAIAMLLAFTLWNAFDAATVQLWYDEGWTLVEVTGVLAKEGLTLPVGNVLDSNDFLALTQAPGPYNAVADSLYHHDTHPPVYFQTLWAWTHVAGTSTFGMRSLSVALMAATAATLYLHSRRTAGAAALLTLALVLCSPGAVYAAVNARGYAMGLFLVTISLIGILHTIDKPKAFGWALAAGLCMGIGSVTHYFTLLAMVPGGLVAFVFLMARKRWANTALMAVAAAPGLAWSALVWVPQQLGARPGQYAGFENIPAQFLSLFRAFANQFTKYSLENMAVGLALTVGASIVLAVFLRNLRLRWRDPAYAVPFASAFGCFIGLLALFWATDKTLLAFSVPRYVVFAVPGLALLLPQLLGGTGRGAAPRTVLLATAAIVAMGVVPRLDSDDFDNPWASHDAASVGRNELHKATPNDLIVITGESKGRIGTTIHMLPNNRPTVYAPTGEVLAEVLAKHDADRLIMRPLFWSGMGDAKPFPNAYYEAAEAAGFETGGMVWERQPTADTNTAP